MSEKNSLPLFIEDVYEALKAAVAEAGGAKVVAARLWPHKPVDQARKELLDALNRDNPRKLDPEETLAILRMARERGYHGAKHWVDGALGYSPSAPVEPEDELGRMLREYLDIQRRHESLKPKIDEAVSRMAVRAVK